MISLRYYIKLLFCDKSEKEFCIFVKTQLGFTPGRVAFYKKALTHKSALKKEEDEWDSNERMEFLGDSILDSIISDFIFKHYPLKDEGFLTKMRSKIVNRKSLNELALHLSLDNYIKSNNLYLKNNNALGNAFEALIGAIFLDKGYSFTQQFVNDSILKKYVNFDTLENTDLNYKSQLIEVVQRNREKIVFTTVENENERNPKFHFKSSVLINDIVICEANGRTKKEAEQNASEIALTKLEY